MTARAVVGALLACLAGGAGTATASAESFAYVYVVANSGGSSGGHAAVCFAPHCFHFQQVDDARIRMRRDDFERLDFDYRVLGNRTLHVRHIAVDPPTRKRLLHAFERRLADETIAFDRLDRIRADRRLLDDLIDHTGSAYDLPGAGYFVADEDEGSTPWWPAAGPPAPPIVAVQREVAERYGDVFLSRRAATLRARIAALEPGGSAAADFAIRYRELLEALVAIEVLRAAPNLRPGVLVDAGPLRPGEAATLRAQARRLRRNLLDLLDSRRPDRGRPLLIGLARLLSVEASLAADSLLLLDPLARHTPRIAAAEVDAHREALTMIAAERHDDLERLRTAFFAADDGSEARWSLLEIAATLALETEHGVATTRSIRLHTGVPLPVRAASRRGWPRPTLDGIDRDSARAALQASERAAAAELDREYAYDLLRRNCVTEIFRTLEAAAAENATAAGSETGSSGGHRPGGGVDVDRGLNFIPAVSIDAIDAAYPVVASEERPSRRHSVLAAMATSEPAWLVALREANVLTARAYRPNPDDSAFLWFTDGPLLLRPVLGAVNLLYGTGVSAVGLAAAPLDGATMLRAGAEGVLYSLPELFLLNVRKGSYRFAPRAWAGSGAD